MKLNEGLLKMAKISAYWLECLGGYIQRRPHSEEIGLRADGHQGINMGVYIRNSEGEEAS